MTEQNKHHLLSRNVSGTVASLAESVITCGTSLEGDSGAGSVFLCFADRILGLMVLDGELRILQITNRPASATDTTSAAKSAKSARYVIN